MAENKVPVLLVGLGGIGGSIVDMIMQKIPESKKSYVGAVAIDTNIEDLKKLEHTKTIWIGEDGLVKDILYRYPEYMNWFPSNRFVNNRGIKDGAGQIRAISRLAVAAATRGDHNVFITMNQEINRVLQHRGDVDVSKFNVFVAGSITGGTGAGSFLQIPFYIREYVKNIMANTSVSIRGLFISADVTADVNPSVINRNAVKVNAYTCLKELNAIYLTQLYEDPENRLDLEFYNYKDWLDDFERGAESLKERGIIPGQTVTESEFRQRVIELIGEGANIPYEAFYIAEKSDNQGTTGNASLDTVKMQVANIIYTILFTPVRPIAAGINDNGVMLDMECSGMNRYSSAGLCAIRYPYEQMKEYVSLSYCGKLIGEEWLLLDQECALQKKDAMDRQKSDPSVQIPDIAETYVRMFEKESGGGEGTRLGHLQKEAFIVNENSTAQPICKLDGYLDDIEERTREVIQDGAVLAAERGCEISLANMKDYDSALKEVVKKTEAVEMYAISMINMVKKRQYEVANEVFPESFDSLMMHRGSSLSVYSFLGNVHPVAARYLCYKTVLALEEKLEELGSGISASDLSGFKRKDYDARMDGIQSAADVINRAGDQKRFFVLPAGKNTLKSVTAQFQQDLQSQIRLIKQYGETQIQLTTYRTLLRRFRQLARNYGIFFEDMKSRIESNNKRINNLENAFVQKEYGIRVAYGSPDAFRRTFEEFTRSAVFALPAESKEAVFLGLCRQACVAFNAEGSDAISSETKLKTEKNIRDTIMNLFETAIMKKMRDYVEANGDKNINISVKEALEKEFCLKNGYTRDVENYDDLRIEYEKAQIELAMREASPMLAVSADAQNISENVYLAMHPDSAELEAGEVSKTATENRLVPEATEATDYMKPYVLIHDGFSRYELICLKARHKYKIDDLVKYGPDSEFARLYRERIANIGQEPTMIGSDAYKTVITPHLSRYWHEEGFIPALTNAERQEIEKNIRRAFIYALGMDVFTLEEEEEFGNQPKWKYVNISRRRTLVTEKGMVIGSGYSDLYKALKNNRRLVNNILDRARMARREEAKTLTIMDPEKLVANLSLLKDLIQEVREDGDSNLLDIMYEMRSREYVDRETWINIFDGLELTLKEYLRDLFGSNLTLVNAVFQQTLDHLYAASETGQRYSSAVQGGADPGSADSGRTIDKEILEHVQELKNVRIFY